jgi:hypothetical protein
MRHAASRSRSPAAWQRTCGRIRGRDRMSARCVAGVLSVRLPGFARVHPHKVRIVPKRALPEKTKREESGRVMVPAKVEDPYRTESDEEWWMRPQGFVPDASLNTAGCLNPRHCDVSYFLSIMSFTIHSLLPFCLSKERQTRPHPSLVTMQWSE